MVNKVKKIICPHGISPKSKCRKCRSEWEKIRSKERYRNDPIYRGKKLKQNKKQYEDHNEYYRVYKKNYYGKNKIKLLQKRKERYIRERVELIKKWREKKRKLVEIFGGKCDKCGYFKNLSVLTFHHINPNDKECNQEWVKYPEKFIQKIREGKIQLLCFNCHTEVHHPNYGDN